VEFAQGVQALQDCLATDRLMRHAFSREALGGAPEVRAELLGQGSSVRLWAVRQRRERSHGHRLAVNAVGQGLDQP
jgi:hypothetical protein